MKDELNELSPFLAKLKKEKKEGLSVPNNYFENFEARLMSRIKEEQALTPKTAAPTPPTLGFWDYIQSLFTPKFATGFSMAILLVVAGIFGVQNSTDSPTNEPLLLAELSTEEAKFYILNNIEEFETEDIVASLALDQIVVFQENIPVLENKKSTKTTENKTSTINKAIKSAKAEDLLKELTEEDLQENYEGLF